MYEQNRNSIWPIVFAIVITAIIVGGGVYLWQQKKIETPIVPVVTTQDEQKIPSVQLSNTVEPTPSNEVDGIQPTQDEQKIPSVQLTNTVEPTPSNEVESIQPKQEESPQFDTIAEYFSLTSNPMYETAKPAGYERAKFGGQGEGINVSPDGVSGDIFVIAKKGWDFGNLEDVETFYFEFVGPSPCWTEENCNEPNTVDYYGPFEGKLKLLVQ